MRESKAKGDNTLRLDDGRLLGYAIYGDPGGQPVFYFHGFPGSRLEAQLADRVAGRIGVRLIALDRPGFGLSDFKPRRAILDWPEDVTQTADALGLNCFAIVGVSGGSPYAAACALRIPQRLTASAIVSGLAPLGAPNGTDRMIRNNHLFFLLARRFPWLARMLLRWTAYEVQLNPERTLRRILGPLPAADQAVLARPEVKQAIGANVAEAFRRGVSGAVCELRLYSRPWGFLLEDIALRMDLWHGEQDRSVPPAMGRYLARVIPNCRANFYPKEGHFSLAINHMEEILRSLVEPRVSN